MREVENYIRDPEAAQATDQDFEALWAPGGRMFERASAFERAQRAVPEPPVKIVRINPQRVS